MPGPFQTSPYTDEMVNAARKRGKRYAYDQFQADWDAGVKAKRIDFEAEDAHALVQEEGLFTEHPDDIRKGLGFEVHQAAERFYKELVEIMEDTK